MSSTSDKDHNCPGSLSTEREPGYADMADTHYPKSNSLRVTTKKKGSSMYKPTATNYERSDSVSIQTLNKHANRLLY